MMMWLEEISPRYRAERMMEIMPPFERYGKHRKARELRAVAKRKKRNGKKQ